MSTRQCYYIKAYAYTARVKPNPETPLFWTYRRIGKLAVAVLPDERLINARGRIEEYLVNQLGVLPEIKEFNPHVTIGWASMARVSPEVKKDPNVLIPSMRIVPPWIALNGLQVYINRIHAPNA